MIGMYLMYRYRNVSLIYPDKNGENGILLIRGRGLKNVLSSSKMRSDISKHQLALTDCLKVLQV